VRQAVRRSEEASWVTVGAGLTLLRSGRGDRFSALRFGRAAPSSMAGEATAPRQGLGPGISPRPTPPWSENGSPWLSGALRAELRACELGPASREHRP